MDGRDDVALFNEVKASHTNLGEITLASNFEALLGQSGGNGLIDVIGDCVSPSRRRKLSSSVPVVPQLQLWIEVYLPGQLWPILMSPTMLPTKVPP